MTLVPLEAIYTSNDTYTEVPPAGADGFSSVTITVDVPSSSPSLITIDRIYQSPNTYYLSDFTQVTQYVQVSLPPGRCIIRVRTTTVQTHPVWNVSMQANSTTSPQTIDMSYGYYIILPTTYVPQFQDSNGESYFYLDDSNYGDSYSNYIYLSQNKFNFDFTTVPN